MLTTAATLKFRHSAQKPASSPMNGFLKAALRSPALARSFRLVPHFRTGDYAGGIQQGVRHVAVIVRRNQPLSVEERRRLDRQTQDRAGEPERPVDCLG